MYSIQLTDFGISRGGTTVFSGLNLNVVGPGIYFIRAPSGWGKSSLFDFLIGGNAISQGKATVNFSNHDVAYVPQKPFIFPGTIVENIELFDRENIDRDVVNALGMKLRLFDPSDGELMCRVLDTDSENLSGGQLKRLGLLRALVKNRPVLLLDEVTSGLDKQLENIVMEILADLSQTKLILFSTHSDFQIEPDLGVRLQLDELARRG